ncbi:hypothetical protein NE237_000338 [Protea cynaroides]|uniref:Cellulose synthase n=1 Tax=Protea cynaroides TaxID=273540 RepID=A0A9Q0KR04_9MAGN|nr:hypothetical protein NE237_000338 [Protea cynaroides]
MMDYLKDKVQPTFVKECQAMKREYEEFKVRINALVAKVIKVPPEGWIMQDGTPWPGNNTKDHPAAFVTSTLMEQGGVLLSSSPAALLKEAIHVISCGYEDKTKWGTEVSTRSRNTIFRSIYYMPKWPAFKGVSTHQPFRSSQSST